MPDFNLPALKELNLNDNPLSTVPNFNLLPVLEELGLQGNALSTVPNFENLLVALSSLDISKNPLTSTPQSLCDREQAQPPLTIVKDNDDVCEK